jgi:hypothetical protein
MQPDRLPSSQSLRDHANPFDRAVTVDLGNGESLILPSDNELLDNAVERQKVSIQYTSGGKAKRLTLHIGKDLELYKLLCAAKQNRGNTQTLSQVKNLLVRHIISMIQIQKVANDATGPSNPKIDVEAKFAGKTCTQVFVAGNDINEKRKIAPSFVLEAKQNLSTIESESSRTLLGLSRTTHKVSQDVFRTPEVPHHPTPAPVAASLIQRAVVVQADGTAIEAAKQSVNAVIK